MNKVFLVLFFIIVTTTTQSHAISIVTPTVTNGSFETGDLTGWTLGPWTPSDRTGVITGTTSILGNTYGPTDGNYFAYLHGDNIGGDPGISQLYQNIGDMPAGSVLSFMYAFVLPDDFFFSNSAGFSLNGNGQNFHTRLVDMTCPCPNTSQISDIPWTKFEMEFLTDWSNVFLTFDNKNFFHGTAYGTMFIDNVKTSIAKVPEPATWLLMCLAPILWGWTRRKKVTQ